MDPITIFALVAIVLAVMAFFAGVGVGIHQGYGNGLRDGARLFDEEEAA